MVQSTAKKLFQKQREKDRARKFTKTKSGALKDKKNVPKKKKFVQKIQNPVNVKKGIKGEDIKISGGTKKTTNQTQQPQVQQLGTTPFNPNQALGQGIPTLDPNAQTFAQPQEQLIQEEGTPFQETEPTSGIRVGDPLGRTFNEAGQQTNIPTIMDLLKLGSTSTTGIGGFNIAQKAAQATKAATNPAIKKGFDEITKATAQGENLITTQGLSNPKAAQSALGQIPKGYERVSHRILETDGKIRVQNVWAAKKITSWVPKLIRENKFASAITGVVGNVILNGFLEEEADQNVNHAIEKAQDELLLDAAEELIEYRLALTDRDMWDYLSLLIPLKGAYTFMKTAYESAKIQDKKQKRLRGAEEGKEFFTSPLEQAQQAEFDANVLSRQEQSIQDFNANLASVREGDKGFTEEELAAFFEEEKRKRGER